MSLSMLCVPPLQLSCPSMSFPLFMRWGTIPLTSCGWCVATGRCSCMPGHWWCFATPQTASHAGWRLQALQFRFSRFAGFQLPSEGETYVHGPLGRVAAGVQICTATGFGPLICMDGKQATWWLLAAVLRKLPHDYGEEKKQGCTQRCEVFVVERPAFCPL